MDETLRTQTTLYGWWAESGGWPSAVFAATSTKIGEPVRETERENIPDPREVPAEPASPPAPSPTPPVPDREPVPA